MRWSGTGAWLTLKQAHLVASSAKYGHLRGGFVTCTVDHLVGWLFGWLFSGSVDLLTNYGELFFCWHVRLRFDAPQLFSYTLNCTYFTEFSAITRWRWVTKSITITRATQTIRRAWCPFAPRSPTASVGVCHKAISAALWKVGDSERIYEMWQNDLAVQCD